MSNRKRLAAVAACAGLAVSAAVRAQVNIVNNVSGAFNDISGTGALVITGDDQSGPTNVSAAAANAVFPAGTLNCCTNGHCGYGGPDTQYFNGTLPANFGYSYPAAAVYWDDMITNQAGAGVYSQEVTENGNQVQVVEWVRMDHYFTSPDNVTFELKIYGGSGGPSGAYAQYVYQSMVFGDGVSDNGASATVGYQYSAMSAEQYSYNTAGSIPDNSTLTLVPGTTGACCLGDGTCQLLSSNNCSSQSGVYHGDNSTCAAANCPSGACCLPDGTCTTSAAAGCAALNGIYGGDGSNCSGACPQGACCTATGCSLFTEAQCTAQGGVFHGGGSTCAASCPIGACCTGDGCVLVNQVGCTALSGTYHGDNSTCAQAGCPVNLVCNGGFESGAFTPCWTQFGDTSFTAVNTGNFVGLTPHGGTYEAHFGPTGGTGGIMQTINVPAGTMLTIDFWYAAVGATNSFSADLGSTNLVSFTNDTSHTTWTEFTFMVAAPSDNPVLAFTTYNPPSYDFLDDIRVTPPGTQVTCYANCDHSTTVPFLNVNDFICFQTHFAAGDSYANCDLSTTPPVLNVNDFICFQTKFAGGCSAP